MRSLILSTILLAAAFSGCLAEPSSSEDATTSDDPSASPTSTNSTSNATATTAAAANTAPTANLSADVANGSAPLNVTFTIEGGDEDGDALNWTLDIDSDGTAEYNGTELPGNVTHEFTEAGNYTAILNVTDGESFAESNITIVVEGSTAFVPKEDDWATWDELGQCHAKGAIAIPGIDHYLHERGDPPGTGYVAGDGTWIYEETNGIEGLQIGGAGETAAYVDCVNPDLLVF